jgi:hypothetical protein
VGKGNSKRPSVNRERGGKAGRGLALCWSAGTQRRGEPTRQGDTPWSPFFLSIQGVHCGAGGRKPATLRWDRPRPTRRGGPHTVPPVRPQPRARRRVGARGLQCLRAVSLRNRPRGLAAVGVANPRRERFIPLDRTPGGHTKAHIPAAIPESSEYPEYTEGEGSGLQRIGMGSLFRVPCVPVFRGRPSPGPGGGRPGTLNRDRRSLSLPTLRREAATPRWGRNRGL